MSSTDDPRDDEERGEEPTDESVLPPGPRRSTYTPPVPREPVLPTTQDDELADVVAANLVGATDTFNVIYQLDDIRPSVPDDVPIEQLAAPPPDARILPADAPAASKPTARDAPAAPPPAPPAPTADAMPSPTQSAVPVDLPPPPEFDTPSVTFVEPPLRDAEPFDLDAEPFDLDAVPEPQPAVTFDLDADVAPAPVVELEAEPEPEPEPELAPETQSEAEPFEEPSEPEPFEPEAFEPEPFEPEAFEPEPFEPEPFETVAWEPEAWEPKTPADVPVDEDPAPQPETPAWSIDEEPPLPVGDPAPMIPTDPAEQAAFLAASGAPSGQRPWIPERQSLRDDELAALISSGSEHPGGTLGVMEELERQMQLREDETREFTEWQESMLAVGTPEALAAVESVMPEFSDILSPSTQSIQVLPPAPAPTFDAPPPAFPAPNSDAPSPALDAPPPAFPAPSFDAPPPALSTAPPAAEAPMEPIVALPDFAEPPALVEPPSMPDAWDIPAVEGDSTPDALVEPSPFGGDSFDRVFTGSISVVTGSVPVTPQELDVDGDDAVDPTDQVPPSFDDLMGPNPGTAPIEPILSPRIPEDEVVLGEAQQLERPRVFSLESAGLEPTAVEQRVGRAARMFWMWFAANSSIVSITFGAVLFSLGLSLRQAIVGILAGVAISFLPLGLGTLAGKRSGQPTMVVSRAAFGVVGNSIPALVAFISRVFWGAAMLWILSRAVTEILVGAELSAGLDPSLLSLLVLAGGLVVALVVALFGYGLLAKFQLVVSIISGVLVIGVIALTASYVDIATALTNRDGSWMLAGTVAVLVFSFLGLLWANSSGDLARYQRPGTSGAGAMLWTSFGAAVPAFVLISYGALLAASNEQIAEGLLTVPFDTIGRLLPVWYPVPLIAAVSLGLISGVIVTIYSGGFALKAVGLSLARPVAAVVTAVLVAGGAVLLTTVSADFTMLFRDLATTLGVPVAAWVGIFAADTMIRNRRYHAESLLRTGGVYPTVHWVNLPTFFVATALGFGLTTATIAGLTWQGFLWPLLGVASDSALAGTDVGVFAALALGLLVPIVAGIPGIRRQEAANPPEHDGLPEQDSAEN